MYHRLINEEDSQDHFQNDQAMFELKNRNRERRMNEGSGVEPDQPKIDFISHTIKPNETLQGIALRYACSVSKLRLYNHLMSDQEFHALSVLKIPVIQNSIFKEAPDFQNVISPQFVDDLVDVSDPNKQMSLKTQVINIGISNYLTNNGSEDYKKFLNNLSEDFREIRKSTLLKMENSTISNSIETRTNTSNNAAKNDKITNTSANFMSCDGSDFGIHWRYLIIVLIIVCLLVPSYVLFNLEHHNSTSNHHPD